MAYGEKIRNAFSFARHSGAVWWYAGYAVALGAVTIVLLLALLFGAGVKSVASLFADSGRLALAALFALAWIGFAVFAGNGVNGAVIQNTVQAGPMRLSW
ncbi:MAG: hypothetical protein Q8P02_03905 [Candidatus Micrarchaeota archaeon]|nr:hypothetical protein [Candidatus Micrarchaeota archaeon]